MNIGGKECLTRQDSWVEIKHRLTYSGRHTKSEIKIFENFFLKQKEPSWPFGEGDSIPLVYRLWLGPEQTADAWRQTVEKMMAYHPMWAEASLKESRAILLEEADSLRYNALEGAPAGFMGGAEKPLLEFFIALYRARGEELIRNVGNGFHYFGDLTAWLKGAVCNPYQLSHYMAELWYGRLSDEYMKELSSDARSKLVVKRYLAALAQRSDTEDDSDRARADYCRTLRDILENRPIPDLLRQWWAEAQNSAKSA